jgi:hypothetical protein
MSITQIKFHATDSRDKVYSLFGLASECEDLLQTPKTSSLTTLSRSSRHTVGSVGVFSSGTDHSLSLQEHVGQQGVLPEMLDYTNCQPCQRGVLTGVISTNTIREFVSASLGYTLQTSFSLPGWAFQRTTMPPRGKGRSCTSHQTTQYFNLRVQELTLLNGPSAIMQYVFLRRNLRKALHPLWRASWRLQCCF